MGNLVNEYCKKPRCEFLIKNECTQPCRCINSPSQLKEELKEWIAYDMGNEDDFMEFLNIK